MGLTYLTNPDGSITVIDDGLPDVPEPDWSNFAAWLQVFPPMQAAIEAARLSTNPQGEPAATSLPTLLVEAKERQNYPAFALSWGLFLQASGMAPADLAQIVAKAADCHLPAEFLEALQPEAEE
jgi:hypothetical protein